MTALYLLNKQQEVFHIVPESDVIELWQNDGINELDTVESTIKLTDKLKEKVDEVYYYAVQNIDDKYTFHLYKAISNQINNRTIELYGLQVGFDEFKANGYIKDYRPENRPISTVLGTILSGTGWELGFVDSRLPYVTTNFYYLNRLDALSKLIDITGCEVDFKVAITGSRITMKYVDVYYQMGEDTGKRFAYGTNALEIVKEHDEAELFTALVGRGKGEELADDSGDPTGSYGRRIMFTDVEWKKSAGNPVDKPKGQEYVELPEATALYGYPDGKPRIDIRVYEDIEDPEEVLKATFEDLKIASRPKVQFKSTVVNTGNLNKGDTVTIVRHELGIKYQTRVFNVKRNRLNNKLTEISLGDYIVQSTAKKNATFTKNVNNRIENIQNQLHNVEVIAADGTKITYGPDQPATAKVDDLWYEELPNGKVNIRRWNGEEWEIKMFDAFGEEIKNQVTEALDKADEAKQEAIDSYEKSITDAKAYTELKANEFNGQLEIVRSDVADTELKANSAVEKADQAIKDAGFAKVDAGTAKQNANDAKTNASTALTTAQTSLTNSGTAISTANTALDAYKNMEIGGRNLLKGTNVSSTLIGNGELNQYSDSYSFAVDTRTFLGKQITTSFKWKIEGTTSATGTFYIQGNYPYPQLSGDEVRIDISLMNGEFARTTTLYGESNVGFTGARIRMDNVTVGAKLIVYDLKIEYGNKSTTWTTAPEDVQVQITDINGELAKKVSQTTFNTLSGTVTNQSTQISQSQTAIGLKADKSLVDTINQTVANHTLSIKATADGLAAKAEKSLVDSLNGTVSSHTSLINLNAEGLALKADSSKVDTLSGTVATHTGQISANSTAIGLRLTSAQVETAITAKNYVNQTTLNATSTGLTAQITQVSNDLNNMEIGGRNLIIRKDERKSTILGPSGGVESGVGSLPKNKIAVVTGESLMFSKNTVTGDNNWRIHWYDASGVFINRTATATNKIQWIAPTNARYVWASYPNDAKVKIERGTKATDWSPAPEDMATVDNFTTLEATVNGINTVVGNKADQSQITQLAGQISSKVESSAYNTKMTQLDSSINLRLESSKVISQINLSTEGILLQGKRIQLDGDVTMTAAFVTDIKAKSLEAVYADIATLKTKVLTADVITSTMVKSDTALITKLFATDANVNVLTAKTAFVNSVKAVTISADKITAGTLNAANVNIINMNASNISTGTMSGANYSLNLNTGVETFRNPSNGSLLSIQQDKFYFDTNSASHYLIPDNEGFSLVPGSGNTGNNRNAGIRLKSTNFNYLDLGLGSDGGFQYRIGGYANNFAFMSKNSGDFVFSHTAIGDSNAGAHMWKLRDGLNGTLNYGKTNLVINGYDGSVVPKVSVYNESNGQLATFDAQFLNLTGPTGSIELSQSGGNFKITHGVNRNWVFAQGNNGTITYGTTMLAVNGHNNDSARLSVYGSNGTTYGYMSAANFDVQSERKYKDNISDFGSALSIISTMRIRQYTKNGIYEIGIITDEAPLQLLSDNYTKVSLYDYTSLAVRGVQELGSLTWDHETKINKLELRIEELEDKIKQMESVA